MRPDRDRATLRRVLPAAVLLAAVAASAGIATLTDAPPAETLPGSGRSAGSGPANPTSPQVETAPRARAGATDPTSATLLWNRLHPDLSSVTDAASLGSGWIVLDRRAGRLHRLTEEGRLAFSFGRRGDGPGEYRDPAGVAVVAETILVAERVGGRLHRFGADGAFMDRMEVVIPGCFVPLVLDAGGTRVGPVLLVRCVAPGGDAGGTDMVVLAPSDGPVRVVWVSEPREGSTGERTLFSEPLLATAPSTVAVGRQSDRCVRLYRVETIPSARPERRCLPERPPVPLPPADRSFLRQHMGRISARGPVRFRVPGTHATLYDLFLSANVVVGVVPGPDDTADLVAVGPRRRSWTSPTWGDGPFLVDAANILESREELHGTRVRVRLFGPS